MTNYAMYPRFSYIDAITRGVTTTIEFTDDHDFTDGELVSFRVDRANGTRELNDVTTRVISHTDTTITVDIDSNNFTPFIADLDVQSPPMAVPAGSSVIPGDNPLVSVNLYDSFDNRRVS